MQKIVSADDRSRIAEVTKLPLWQKVRLAWRLRRDRRVPALMILPLAGVIIYIVLPFHVLPRRLKLLRTFDDLLVAAAGLWLLVKLIPKDVLDEHLGRLAPEHDAGEDVPGRSR